MPATIIMGGQWGDEGKGKLTDALAGTASMVVRANGGSNAGHTVKTDRGTFKLHLIPSGMLNDDVDCVIGAGVVIDLATLAEELRDLANRGIDTSRLRISDRAHIVLPYHAQLDRLEEQRRESEEIGTTLRGNGPAYADKVSRHGIRMCDLLDDAILRRKLAIEVDSKNAIFANVFRAEEVDFKQLYQDLMEWAEPIRPLITPTEVLVQDTLAEGKNILIECAQGAMLDIDYGTYPYVTSSSPTSAGACQGAGVAPTQVERILGVYKAYSTRVGAGPMPTELLEDTGEIIRRRGNEYGTTTGRPRRTGWFDGVAARQSGRLNGVTEVALTLLDVLDTFETVSVCTGYTMPNGELHHVPAQLDNLIGAQPQWASSAGWMQDTTELRSFDDLPLNAKMYIDVIQNQIGAPVTYVGVGPAREQLLHR
ncbi:MAG: adenylosuccinate synthase [Thermomicrobiales bacterium]|nr:adenylosuccinate synthase [Thermomicrobiales bacterium]MCO5223844.1 adenylosuccinate synthase [Thermomicrobiales bacterium]